MQAAGLAGRGGALLRGHSNGLPSRIGGQGEAGWFTGSEGEGGGGGGSAARGGGVIASERPGKSCPRLLFYDINQTAAGEKK